MFGLIINLVLFFRIFNFFQYKSLINKKLVKKVLTFSMPLMVQDFFGVLMSRVDNLILVYFRPLTEVAIYNVITPPPLFINVNSCVFPLIFILFTVFIVMNKASFFNSSRSDLMRRWQSILKICFRKAFTKVPVLQKEFGRFPCCSLWFLQ